MLFRSLKNIKAREGIDIPYEDLAPAVHLLNQHRIDFSSAMDQSSLGANDNGIDAWYLALDGKLYIYQSKFSTKISTVLKGLNDLERATKWLESFLCEPSNEEAIQIKNKSLRNLVKNTYEKRLEINEVELCLLSSLPSDDIKSSKKWVESANLGWFV